MNLLHLLKDLIKNNSLKNIANELNVASGTILRWIELENIPSNYEFDLLKLGNIEIDYSNYSSKQKDQFYTPKETALSCYNIFKKIVNELGEKDDEFIYIEPSAGQGGFLEILPKGTIGIDIEPKINDIITMDYLDWKPEKKDRYVVIGNPPFGLRGHKALKFINHSSNFAEYVCFILPQLFVSDGKGVPRKRVKGLNLIYSGNINNIFYEPNNNEVKINTIFQIWSKYHKNIDYEINEIISNKIKIYSLSNGGTSSTIRNKDMINKCHIYIPSTCFGKENMKTYLNFDELPSKKGYGIIINENIDIIKEKMINFNWNDIAFLSTNSAYNLRSSQIYKLFNN